MESPWVPLGCPGSAFGSHWDALGSFGGHVSAFESHLGVLGCHEEPWDVMGVHWGCHGGAMEVS